MIRIKENARSMKLTKEQQKLAEDNHNLIGWFAKIKGIDFNEYYDILAIGLCKAAMAYDENKGKFSVIAYHCMNNELKKVIAKNNQKSVIPFYKIVSYEEIIKRNEDDNTVLCFSGCLSDNGESIYDAVHTKMMLSNLMENLKPNERKILKMLVTEMKRHDIALNLKCSNEKASSSIKALRKKLRDPIKKWF